MVNQIILNYLNSYKDNFPLENLKKEILSKGYTEEDFNEALSFANASNSGENFGKDLEKIGSWKMPEQKNTKKQKTKNKKKTSKGKVILLILFILILLGIFSIIALNYMHISFFGFNIFDYLMA